MIVNENIDISQYKRLISFLKIKSKVLKREQVLSFLNATPNEIYLLHKAVLVMGAFGGLRREELVKMTIDDMEDKESVLLVKETKTSTSKSFTFIDEENIGALNIERQYAALRPKEIKERFFLTYVETVVAQHSRLVKIR